MGKIEKHRCPHEDCRKVNDIDIDKELEREVYAVYKMRGGEPAKSPKYLIVTCMFCGREFKIDLTG